MWTAHHAARIPPPEAATRTRGSTLTTGAPAGAPGGAATAQVRVSGSASQRCRLPARVTGPDGAPAPAVAVPAVVVLAAVECVAVVLAAAGPGWVGPPVSSPEAAA